MSGEINRRLQQITKDLKADKLAKLAYPVFRDGAGSFKGTPVKSGNARRNTKLRNDHILAQYAYAQRLDQGYSKQAPDGMTQPTLDWVSEYIKDYSKG